MSRRSLCIAHCALTVFVGLAPNAAYADLIWVQAGGTSGSSGAGAHVNSYVTGGTNGSATVVAPDTVLSYGTVTDGGRTIDYAVRFLGGDNPLKSETVNNAFVVHSDGSADFYSASQGSQGQTASGTYADNGSATLSVSFYTQSSFDNISGTGVSTNARFSLIAINQQPTLVGGNAVGNLNTNEFYDLDWGAGGAFSEVDPDDQIITNTTSGVDRLANYDPTKLPTGSTGPTDPGTGGITDPLTGDVRLEFNTSHTVAAASWEFNLPEASTFIISRAGDDGQRSGIGLSGGTLSAPEPSSAVLTLLISFALAHNRKTRKPFVSC